jgi:dihydroorotate dehydrogenase electron transfer subunit
VIDLGQVTFSEEVAPGVGLLGFTSSGIAAAYRPGQFVHVATGDDATLLRRPFSVARVRGADVQLLYRVIGAGTRWLRERRPGDPLDVMGPLGRPFALRDQARHTLLVAGGLGLAPLLGLGESLRRGLPEGTIEGLLGLRTAEETFAPAVTTAPEGIAWDLATDDGSAGHAGTVVDLLEKRLGALAADGAAPGEIALYAAGPEPMLAATSRLCVPRGLDLQVTLEAHMACGVGACRACGIVVRTNGSVVPDRVCKEGPVFAAADIRWEEVGK